MKLPGMDLTQYTPRDDFPVVPPGEYIVFVSKSSVEENKKGTGTILKLDLTIGDGQFKGLLLFDNLNIAHQTQQAEEIARAKLRSLAEACGLNPQMLKDSNELHDRPCIAVVKARRDGQQGTEIGRYKPLHPQAASASAAAHSSPAPRPAANAPAGDDRPSWARN